jgi:hypothetical protein
MDFKFIIYLCYQYEIKYNRNIMGDEIRNCLNFNEMFY